MQPLSDAHDQTVPFYEGQIRTVRCTHGEGAVGRTMEHGVGYFVVMLRHYQSQVSACMCPQTGKP